MPSGSKAKPLHMFFSNVGRLKDMIKVKGACILLRSWVSSNGMGRILPLINKGKSTLIFLKNKGKQECVSLMDRDKGLDKYNRVLNNSDQIKHLVQNNKD